MDDFKAKRFPNLEERATFTDLCLPLIRGDSPHGRHGTCCAEEVHTWLGAIACGIEVAYDEGGPGDYVSTFTPLQPVTPKQHGIKTRWNGMVTSSHICSILKDIKYVILDIDTGVLKYLLHMFLIGVIFLLMQLVHRGQL